MSEKRFNKEYWTLENGKVYYFSTFNSYSLSELVNELNKLENEKAQLKSELNALRRIKMNLEFIKDDIEKIELLEDREIGGLKKLCKSIRGVLWLSEKQISVKEVNEIIEGIFSEYVDKFDKMSFSEIAIVENVLIKLQWALDKKFGELN